MSKINGNQIKLGYSCVKSRFYWKPRDCDTICMGLSKQEDHRKFLY